MGMLNYETLLSSYDDKLTLMQWLKKVEAALKNASATSFVLNKKGNATISFSIVFEDGTSLESGDIVLQQGESVQSAYVQNGHLHLVLTNGDDLDAGNMFNGNVSINGNFEVTGRAKLPNIEGDENNDINVDGNIVISDGGISIGDGAVSTPILTSENDNIEAQKPVIEVMNGYTFTIASENKTTLLYVGAVKNGNKLTLAIFGTYTRIQGESSTFYVGTFRLPNSVLSKLVPYSIASTNLVLDHKKIEMVNASSLDTIGEGYVLTQKEGGISIMLRNLYTLTANDTYYFRYEVTFLLSDNMAA